jgi:two component transcriptional regulator, winged helix family
MQSAGILLIDDDRRLAEMVGRYLGQAGFSVQVQGTARAGLEALVERTPDLILLDLMLPDGDGLDVCRQIHQRGGPAARVPILMLTARGETTDRVVGLEVGADDYLPKPFEPRELLARVRALLRRAAPVDVLSGGVPVSGGGPAGPGYMAVSGGGSAGPGHMAGAAGSAGTGRPDGAAVAGSLAAGTAGQTGAAGGAGVAGGIGGAGSVGGGIGGSGSGGAQAGGPAGNTLAAGGHEVLTIDDLEIDEAAREVRVAGERRTLTGYQFDLLRVLARHAGRVMSREQLMDQAKGQALEAFDRSIDVHVGKIRQAIETDPRQPVRLLTVRGVGYVLARARKG